MANANNIINAAFFLTAMAAKDADFKALLEQCIGYTQELETKVSELNVELDTAQTERDEAIKEMGDLSEKLDMQEKVKSHDGILVTIREEHFLLIGRKFIYGGAEHTADELAKDSEQLEKMLDKRSGSLIPAEELTEGITE